MARSDPFDRHFDLYEQWFTDNHFAFLSELAAVRNLLPASGKGVEIGVGSGIFAVALGISEGCDPSATMMEMARKRGINAITGVAENMPYGDAAFDYALMVTTICFVDDAVTTMYEIRRVLKPGGEVIIGFVDRDSEIGRLYMKEKEKSLFYRVAEFYSTSDIYKLLNDCGFEVTATCQTVFGNLEDISAIQEPLDGYGKGSFVVIRARSRSQPVDRQQVPVK